MQRKKVLILTYYWPPSGGIGGQRWLKFAKHLRTFGWEPIIYTAKNANYPIFDETLVLAVPEDIKILRLKVPEPNTWINKLLFWKKKKINLYKNQQKEGNQTPLWKKVLWFIRGNFFIPDARCYWVKPSIRYLRKVLKQEKIDALISTGPPHSMHLIAKELKKEFNLPWISDFRDPWITMDYLQEMYLTKYAKRKHARLEREILKNSDTVIVIGPAMYQEFKDRYQMESTVIWNGFEGKINDEPAINLDRKFSITYVGSFVHNRNCNDLWEILSVLIKENKPFAKTLEIKLVGYVSPTVIQAIEQFGLQYHLTQTGLVKHQKAEAYQQAAQVLLLPINRITNAEHIITGKLFEYLKAKRPILMLGPPNGDAAAIISTCNAGYCCDFGDQKKIKDSLMERYSLYLEHRNTIHSKNVEHYSAYHLTKKLAEVLNHALLSKN